MAPKKAKVASESAPIYLSEVSPELNKVAKGGEEGKEALGLFTAFKVYT